MNLYPSLQHLITDLVEIRYTYEICIKFYARYICSCTVKLYNTLKEKNALVKSLYYITEYTVVLSK